MNGVSTIKIKNTTKSLVIEIINADEVSTIDNDLMKSDYLGCHPCINTATLKIKMTDLLEKIVPATGHPCKIVTLKTEE